MAVKKKVNEEVIEGYTTENTFKKIFRVIKNIYNKETLIELLKIFGIVYLVTFIWQQLEIYFEGAIRANHVDSIIAFILVLSLYGNLKVWESKDNGKKN